MHPDESEYLDFQAALRALIEQLAEQAAPDRPPGDRPFPDVDLPVRRPPDPSGGR